MQAQASQAPSRFFVCGNGITDHTFDIRCRQWRHLTRDPQPGRSGRPSMLSTLRSIYREAGVKGLYAGLPVTMLIAVPANVLYFATYESLRDYILAQRTLRAQRSGSSEAPAGPGRAALPLYTRLCSAGGHLLSLCSGVLAPLIAGGFGRAVAVSACAPLEVVRTRLQDGVSKSAIQRNARPVFVARLAAAMDVLALEQLCRTT